MRQFGLAILLVILGYGLLRGEVIYLHNGGKIEGKILEWREETIIVKTKWGVVKVLRDQIKSIEKGKNLQDIYRDRLGKLERDDLEGYYKLGKWCIENGLKEEGATCLQKVLDQEPAHKGAHRALGHQYYRGKWLTHEEYMRSRGFIFYAGEWMTKEDYNNRVQGMIKFEGKWLTKLQFEELRRKKLLELNWGYREGGGESSGGTYTPKPGRGRPRPPKPIVVPEDAKELLKLAKSSNREKRIAAYKALQEKGKDALEALRRQLFSEKNKLKEQIKNYFRERGNQLIPQLGGLLKQRQKAARDFIMDPSRYPEANHGRAAQPQVDQLVGAVRQVYDHPFKEVIGHSKRLKKLMADLALLVDDLKTYAGLPESYDYEVEDLDKRISKAIKMENRFAPAGSFAVLEYNKQVKTSVDKEERSCVLVTNKYRMMMGMKPLKIDEPLVQAARKHSADMERQRYFDHTSKDGRTPGQRCAAEGAGYYTGENIAMGMGTGEGAFSAWYNSSGHHRNMLRHHISIGIGKSGSYWTEDFGGGGARKR